MKTHHVQKERKGRKDRKRGTTKKNRKEEKEREKEGTLSLCSLPSEKGFTMATNH